MKIAQIILRRTASLRTSLRSVSQCCSGPKYMSTQSSKGHMDPPLYLSSIDAEPLHRYYQGGYHPIILGEFLHSGRYKVLHKLGWDGYSTVWLARDQRDEVYVAIKIGVAEAYGKEIRELQVMKQLAASCPRPKHTVLMFDNFHLKGPNGWHICLVYEILGPNIPDIIDAHFPHGRLPGKLAKRIAKQSLNGLRSLHQHNIGHGDIHTRNLVFTIPDIHNLTEEKLTGMLGAPEVGHIRRSDGKDLEPGVPEYIVRPTSRWTRLWNPDSTPSIKLIDFGEAFLQPAPPRVLHTPLPVRAPEVIFEDRIDYRVDLWSMGCILFELFTGQLPFDSFLITPGILVGQMREMAGDNLPERWHDKLKKISAGDYATAEEPRPNLQEWLEEVYFDHPQSPDLIREDVARLGHIIGTLLQFEPSARASAGQVLVTLGSRSEKLRSNLGIGLVLVRTGGNDFSQPSI